MKPEDKFRIYQKYKQEQEEKEVEISEEGKRKIYEEFKEKHIIYISEDDLLRVNKTAKTIIDILSPIIFILLICYYSFLSALIFFIVTIVLGITLERNNILILRVPRIKYKCPFCSHNHSCYIGREQISSCDNSNQLGISCLKCKREFTLLLCEEARETFVRANLKYDE